MFKELFEGQSYISTSTPKGSSSLCIPFNYNESNKIYDAIKENPESDYKLFDFIEEVDAKEKYSHSIYIKQDNIGYLLYSASGTFRIGAGECCSECKIVKKYFNLNKLINILKDGKVK